MRRKRVAAWVLLAVPWVVAGVLCWLSWPFGSSEPPRPGAVVVAPQPGFHRVLALVALVSWAAAVAVGVVAIVRPRVRRRLDALIPRFCVYVGLTAGLIPVIVLPVALFSAATGWVDVVTVRVPSGAVFRVHQGLSAYILCEQVDAGPMLLRERIINGADIDFPARLVRPAGEVRFGIPRAGYGKASQLAVTKDGRWLAYLYQGSYGGKLDASAGTHCLFIYDLRDRKFYGNLELASFSPFLFAGPRDHLDEDDVQALFSGRGYGLETVEPAPQVLVRDLANANPEVRAVAARLIVAERYPESRKEAAAALRQLVQQSSDPTVRQAATEALEKLKPTLREVR